MGAVLTTLAPSRQQNSVTERADHYGDGRNALMGIGALILKSLRTVFAVYRPVNADTTEEECLHADGLVR